MFLLSVASTFSFGLVAVLATLRQWKNEFR